MADGPAGLLIVPGMKSFAPRVLSLQSHVVSGYVGNKAASLPLQVLGIDVDMISSCMLSNHTGYKNGARGPRMTAKDIGDILDGMESNGLLANITHILTGYVGREDVLSAVEQIIERVTAARPKNAPMLEYILDPVMGDDGKLYVDKGLIAIYRERLLPLATCLTPNCFELSLLAEVPHISSESEAFYACRTLHKRAGIPVIVVTGATFGDRPGIVSLLISTQEGDAFALDAQLLNNRFTGSGDLCCALIVAWSIRCPGDLRSAYHRAMSTVSAILRRTSDAGPNPGTCALPEMKLVQSIQDILDPPTHLVDVREVSYLS